MCNSQILGSEGNNIAGKYGLQGSLLIWVSVIEQLKCMLRNLIYSHKEDQKQEPGLLPHFLLLDEKEPGLKRPRTSWAVEGFFRQEDKQTLDRVTWVADMPAFDSSELTIYAASWHRSGAAASPLSTTSGNKASSEKGDRKDPSPMSTMTLAQPFTLSPIRFRWSCSGSDAHRRKVATSLAICDMVAGVPGPRTNGEGYLWELVPTQGNPLCTMLHRGRDWPLPRLQRDRNPIGLWKLSPKPL